MNIYGINRYAHKLDCFANFAMMLSRLSTCKRSQNGAIVFPTNCFEVLSIGYNGPASGISNDACTGEEGICGCAHAEMNAITKLSDRKTPSLIFTTSTPCVQCANAILNSGNIVGIIYKDLYRDLTGFHMLKPRIPTIAYTEIRNIILGTLPTLDIETILCSWANIGKKNKC